MKPLQQWVEPVTRGQVPSDNPHAQRSCERKYGYASRAQAKKSIKHQARRHHGDMTGMESYECPYCGYWHTGHSSWEKI